MSNESANVLEAYNENPTQFCFFRLVGSNGIKTKVNKFDIIFSEGIVLESDIDLDIYKASTVLHNNMLYVVGGFALIWYKDDFGEDRYFTEICSQLFCLNLSDTSSPWQTKASLNKPRYRFGCTVHNDEIFVAGGEDERNILNSVESYNPIVDQWKTKPHMMKHRAGCALASKGELLYALGGRHRYGIRRNTVEIFASLVWKPGPPMLKKRSDFPAVVLNDELYAIGGHASYFGYLSHVEKLTNGRWKEVASLNLPRSRHHAIVSCGKIYVYGGENMFAYLDALEVYDPMSNEWSIEDFTYLQSTICSIAFLAPLLVLLSLALMIILKSFQFR